MADEARPDHPVGSERYRPVVEALGRLGALQVVGVDDLSDWTAYPQRECLPDEVLADVSDLARFLGGDDTSFTGDLLRLVKKARSSPENLNRLAVGFPRVVTAWIMWDTLSFGAPPTAGDLARILTFAYGHRSPKADVPDPE